MLDDGLAKDHIQYNELHADNAATGADGKMT